MVKVVIGKDCFCDLESTYFDLQDEFPCLTTKQLYFRQAILEMLWIYQAQSNDVRWLQERNVRIWDEWEINEDGMWIATQNVLEDGKLVKKEVVKPTDKVNKFLERVPKDFNPVSAEMEAFALFYVAKILNKKASCLMSVVDSEFIDKIATQKERETGLKNMIILALESSLFF